MLCCGVLWCAVLCCAVLCCSVLCCAALCSAVLCCALLCFAVPCCAVLCFSVLCFSVLCCAFRFCAFLFCAFLFCAFLFCAVLCCAVQDQAMLGQARQANIWNFLSAQMSSEQMLVYLFTLNSICVMSTWSMDTIIQKNFKTIIFKTKRWEEHKSCFRVKANKLNCQKSLCHIFEWDTNYK